MSILTGGTYRAARGHGGLGRRIRSSETVRAPLAHDQRAQVAARLRWAEAAVIIAASLAGSVIRGGLPAASVSSLAFSVGLAGAVGLLWIAIAGAMKTVDPMLIGVGATEYRRILSAAAIFLAIVALLQLVSGFCMSRAMLLITLALGVLGSFVVHQVAVRRLKNAWRDGRGVARALLVARPERFDSFEKALHNSDGLGISIVGRLAGPSLWVRSSRECAQVPARGVDWLPLPTDGVEETESSVLSAVDSIDADMVILADTSGMESWAFRDLTWALHERGVALAVEPAVGDVALSRMAMSQLNGTSLLQIGGPAYNRAMNLHKRLFDIVVSSLALVILAPVLLGVALLVKCGDNGAIFYGAKRIGVGGRPFKMWKFRSMVPDAEARLAAVRAEMGFDDNTFFKAEDDPRITRVGRVIRKTSIDELPQLFNVLRGDMSLVGPRPMVDGEGAEFANFVERRVLVRPGITGLWQVSGRSDISDEERVRLDLMYVENWSMVGDLAIISKTVSSVLKMEGAY